MRKLLFFLLGGLLAPLFAQNLEYNADIHAHIPLKPYHLSYPYPAENIWDEMLVSYDKIYKFPKLMGQYQNVPATSCSNLNLQEEGNVKLLWTCAHPVPYNFTHMRKMMRAMLFNDVKWSSMLGYFSSASKAKVYQLYSGKVDYFEELKKEYELITSGANIANRGRNYQVFRSRQEMQTWLNQGAKHIGMTISIEGGHSLGTGTPETMKMEKENPEKLDSIILSHVDYLKNYEYPTIAICYANHYWNQLCGHSRTHRGAVTLMLNETFGMYDGITPLGFKVLDRMLDTTKGNRILVDLKHMSPRSRKEYYQWVFTKYGNTVPLIYSHGGVNGQALMPELHADDKSLDKAKSMKKGYLYPWSSTLYDEEIRFIYRSKGLIGLMLEDSRLGGKKALKIIHKTLTGTAQRRDEYLKLLFANAFHIAKTVNDKTAWDIVCIGSDFDGAINPMDHYYNASRMDELRYDMIRFLKRVERNELKLKTKSYPFSNEDFQKYSFGYTPEELVAKIMQENVTRFLLNNLPNEK